MAGPTLLLHQENNFVDDTSSNDMVVTLCLAPLRCGQTLSIQGYATTIQNSFHLRIQSKSYSLPKMDCTNIQSSTQMKYGYEILHHCIGNNQWTSWIKFNLGPNGNRLDLQEQILWIYTFTKNAYLTFTFGAFDGDN